MTSINFLEFCSDPNLAGPWFQGDSWKVWNVIDKVIFGLPLDPWETATYRELTGRDAPPAGSTNEVWIAAGRRAAKTLKAAALVVFAATIGVEKYGWRRYLVPGETAVAQVIAVDRDQARVCLNYVRAMLRQPMLAPLVVRETADAIELSNGIAIEIVTNDKRRVRGRTAVCVVLDEVAHWRSESSMSADEDVFAAVQASTATIPNALIIAISSPYAKNGLFWRKYRDNFGKAGSILVIRAPTWVLNPNLSRDSGVIAEAYANDPAAADAEFGARFRNDLETFVAREVVEEAVVSGRYELPPMPGVSYCGFADAAGGSGQDSFTSAVAHIDPKSGRAVLDAVRETKPPFGPEATIVEHAAFFKSYRISQITMDRWGGDFPAEQFRKHRIFTKASERIKSDIYKELLPALNSGQIELLDNRRLISQLCALERRTSRGGRDSIDHPAGLNDDLINSAAGALTSVSSPDNVLRVSHSFWGNHIAAENSDAYHDMMLRNGGLRGRKLRWHMKRPVSVKTKE